MPLIKSTSKEAFGKNIARERAAGRPEKQAVAIAYSEKREAAKSKTKNADQGESQVTRRPSNSSSANPKTGQSRVMQPMSHSSHTAKRSEDYHNTTVEPTYTRMSSLKMTRAEHQLNNDEDMDEKGHKL